MQAEIREQMIVRTLQDGEYLYQRGADATGLYQVLSGFLQLKATGASGNGILATIYGPGCYLGELPLLDDSERIFDAQAQGEVQVAALPKPAFEELAQRHPEIYQQLAAKLRKIIVHLFYHIEDTALLTLTQRLAKLMISAVEAYGTHQQANVVIAMPLSQADMGKMLGVTRHSIQRELKHWQEKGVIKKQQGNWVVTNLEALQSLQKNTP